MSDVIMWKGKNINDLTPEELEQRKTSFRYKMKVLYINIIVKEASLIELHKIMGDPETDWEEETKEIKFYLARMYPKEEVDEKYKGVVDYLDRRIAEDHPTIASLMKAHRDAHCRGESTGSLVH